MARQPCFIQQQLPLASTVAPHQQPRLTKALLDQHEEAALTSLLLMQQSIAVKVCQPCPTPAYVSLESAFLLVKN